MKKKLLLALSMSAVLMLASCGVRTSTSSAAAGGSSGGNTDTSEQTNTSEQTTVYAVSIAQPESTSIYVGSQLVLEATVTVDGEVNEDETVTWSTSNADIATVSDGTVTGVSAGEVTITVT